MNEPEPALNDSSSEAESEHAGIAQLRKAKQLYANDPGAKSVSFLLYGPKGCGKTTAIGTAPGPVLLYSFDPNGTQVLDEEIESGKVIPIRFEENEVEGRPVLWDRFVNTVAAHRDSGVFDLVGAVALDSFTMAFQAAIFNTKHQSGVNEKNIARAKVGKITIPGKSDYGATNVVIMRVIRLLANQPCHFILTAHEETEKDGVLGDIIGDILASPNMRVQVSIQVGEQYHIENAPVGGKVQRVFATVQSGRFPASTKIGAKGKLSSREPLNIAEILKKCGREWQDKPFIT